MIAAELPANERERILKLNELGILDTLEEQAYDDLTRLAAEICDTPIALVSLVDENRQWFKSHHGLDAKETPRDLAFCAHAILQNDLFIVEDSDKDERFYDNPLVTDAPHVKFYAGAPLIMSNDIKLGTLCVIANEARSMTDSQKAALKALARQVVSQLELRLKVKQLQALDHAKDEFISMVSHELRTPLTTIYGSLSLLINKTARLDNKQQQIVEMAYRNASQLGDLVNDILDLAKLESGRFDINLEEIDLVALIQKSAELNLQYCKEYNCNLVVSYPDDITSMLVKGDEQRLLQVLSNFISNAAKYTNTEDQIEINLKESNGYAVVEVIDHGAGIPLDQQELLFTKFRQLHAATNNKMPGTGLGLNISKCLVEQQGGKIGFKSDPDEKTSFYFELPVCETTVCV